MSRFPNFAGSQDLVTQLGEGADVDVLATRERVHHERGRQTPPRSTGPLFASASPHYDAR